MGLLMMVTFSWLVASANGEESDCQKGEEKLYSLLGCYEEFERPNPLMFDRHNIQWGSIEEYMKNLACECAKRAKSSGFAGFALHYFGECYGKTTEQLEGILSKEHLEHKCVGDQKYDKCNRMKHDHCTGRAFAEAVYKLVSKKINGGFGEWQSWTECSKECGPGIRRRERDCDKPLPQGGGNDCSLLGPYSQSEICKIKDCSVNGGYGSWTTYGACSTSCGGGIKTRTRNCNSPSPLNGGKNCSALGASKESISCNTQDCLSPYSNIEWLNGDGIGGTEVGIGIVANKEECYTRCSVMTNKNGELANGATTDASYEQACYCEFGQTGRSGSPKWKNALIRRLKPAQWEIGVGMGGSEELIGDASNKQECYVKCSKRRKDGKLANGASVDKATESKCYCEYGQSATNPGVINRLNTFIKFQ